jgi:hypothetical protein
MNDLHAVKSAILKVPPCRLVSAPEDFQQRAADLAKAND